MQAGQRNTLTASLGELASLDALPGEIEAPEASIELEPLPSLELPADRRVTTARELAASAVATDGAADGAPAGTHHVTGAAGCASALVVRALAHRTKRRVVAVTADIDAARALAADVSFLLGERDADDAEEDGAFGKVLLFTPNEASPYAEISPDRRGAETRLATLFHLAVELPWTVLVCPVAALSRKVIPRDEVLEHAELIVAEQEIDRDKLTARLAQMGYVRSPLVEDPGTFAVRGALLDVWSPSTEAPVRVEFYGDMVMSLKAFDPENQRTLREVRDAWISPAREAILTPAAVERARERVRA
jgi:transcription-repair coupling factor (superfamily II helicase)